MQKILSSFLLSILFCLPVNAQWEILNEGETTWLIDKIYFISDDVGFSSNFRNLIKTTDFGFTWAEIKIDGYDWGEINDFEFFNDSVGWVHAHDYSKEGTQLFFTSDGGNSWQLKTEFPENLYLTDTEFIDEDIVYALLYENGVIKTTDAGTTWIEIIPGTNYERFWEMEFTTPESGFIIADDLGRVILRTSDGGNSWEERITDFTELWNLYHYDDSTIYFTARQENKMIFCVTQDNFNSWTIKSELDGIGAFGFSSPDTVYGLVDNNIAMSSDAGSSWEVIQRSADWHYGNFYFNGKNQSLLTSLVPLVIGSHMGGRIDLRLNEKKKKWAMSYLTYDFRSVQFINELKGFAAGGASVPHWSVGDIFMTTDGGKSWDISFSPGNPISACQFLDENLGYILVNSRWDGEIFRTTNGGLNWSSVYRNDPDSAEINFAGNDLIFLNETTGWAAGYDNDEGSGDPESFYAAVLGTNDGGTNWNLLWKYAVKGTALNSIHVADSTLWAVGEKGIIVKSAGPDSYEARSDITDLPLNDVFFRDENNGWIAGGIFDSDKYHILLKTTDGGESWNKITELGFHIYDMYFSDSLHGWAAGNGMWDSGGLIMETFDGGLTWNPQAENLSSSLKSLHFKDGYGWAVGGIGLILKTDGTTWVDQRTGENYPSGFSLSQNYPNPFNPTTTIEYSIPVNSREYTASSIKKTEDRKQITVSKKEKQLFSFQNPASSVQYQSVNQPNTKSSGNSVLVQLKVYDILGSEVATLVNEHQRPGNYEVTFEAGNLSSGVYFYKLESGKLSKTKKLVLLK